MTDAADGSSLHETEGRIQWPWPVDASTAGIDQLQEAIRRLSRRSPAESPDEKWLLDLHRDATSLFIHENNRIWTTGSIFIAIAFTSFALSANIRETSVQIATGITSVLLILVWNLIADRQRFYQARHRFWIDAIDAYFLGASVPEGQYLHPSRRFFSMNIRRLRWSLVFILLAAVILRSQLPAPMQETDASHRDRPAGPRDAPGRLP